MATEHVYTTQTPGSVDNNDGQGIVLGMVWKAAVDGTVTGGRVYVGTKPTALKLGLYSIADEATGVLLKSVTYTIADVTNSAWNEISFATPYVYTAGTNLVIVYYSSDRYSFLSGFLNADVINGNVRGLQKGVPFSNGRFQFPATDLAFPTGNGNGAGYFADVSFSAGGVGAVSGALGSVTGVLAGDATAAAAASTAHVPTPGWGGYLNIAREAARLAADERGRPPVACPNDGEPLRSKGGILHCPYDGYRWP